MLLKNRRGRPSSSGPFSFYGATEVLPLPSTGFLAFDQFRKVGRGFPALLIVQVSVYLQSEAHIGMPQTVSDDLWGNAF